jgi:hypothetical protein
MRPRGDRDLTREQFVTKLGAAELAIAGRCAGRATEAELARHIGISRTSLWSYRRAYGVPALAEQTLNTQGAEAPVPSLAMPARRHPFAGKRKPRGFAVEVVSAHVGATVAAAGIGAVIADTGALAAGDYRIVAHLGSDGVVAAGKSVNLEHRNAANGANVKELGRCAAACSIRVEIPRLTLAANERVRAVGGSVAHGAGENASAHIEAIAIPS